MRYLLMICGESPAETDDGEPEIPAGCGGWVEEMQRKGILRDSVGLHSPRAATTVQVRDAEVLIVDGPFAETKDQIGGFSVIECDNLEEAIEVAAGHPAARAGMIEIRPVREV